MNGRTGTKRNGKGLKLLRATKDKIMESNDCPCHEKSWHIKEGNYGGSILS